MAVSSKPQIEVEIDHHTDEWTMLIHNVPGGKIDPFKLLFTN